MIWINTNSSERLILSVFSCRYPMIKWNIKINYKIHPYHVYVWYILVKVSFTFFWLNITWYTVLYINYLHLISPFINKWIVIHYLFIKLVILHRCNSSSVVCMIDLSAEVNDNAIWKTRKVSGRSNGIS